MDASTTTEPTAPAEPKRPFYRQPAVKLLCFLLCTPLWAVIVWTDPEERRAVKVFAALAMLAVAGIIAYHLVAGNRRPPVQVSGWETADQERRLGMLADLPVPGEQNAYSAISQMTQAELQAMIGEPDRITEDGRWVYEVTEHNRGDMQVTVTIIFDRRGRVDSQTTYAVSTDE